VLAVLQRMLQGLGSSQQELSKAALSFLVSLLVSGAAGPALAAAQDWSRGADPSLVRHFILLVRAPLCGCCCCCVCACAAVCGCRLRLGTRHVEHAAGHARPAPPQTHARAHNHTHKARTQHVHTV
jgi:hypothetical protein